MKITKISILVLITIIAAATIIATIPPASAATTTVTKSPTTYTGTWTAPQNALAQGSPIAEDSTTNKQETYSGYSFTIPAGATITKVEVGIFASSIASATIKFQVSIDGTTYPYSYTATPPDFYTTGFSSDYQTISGISWTTTNVNQIRVLVTGFVGTGKTAYLDWVPIRVTYNVQAASTTTTQLSASSITLGGSITDVATVTTGATGNVVFQVSTDGVTFSQYGAAKSLSGTNPNTATSDAYTPSTSGTYYFRAVYQGDSNYLTSQSLNNAEILSVNQKVTSTTTTQLSENGIMLGGSVTDTATVTTGATGNVVFEVSTNGIDFTQYGTAKALSAGLATSDSYTPATSGTYYFRAVYQGDGNYLASQSADNAEILTVTDVAVLPEYPLGALLAIGSCLVAFVAYKKRGSILKFRNQ